MDPVSPRRRNWLTLLRDTTFRSLRHRDYRLYFVGQAVSFTGSWVQSTALLWSVYALTNDAGWPPLILAATVGPTLLLGAVGGALADRFAKRPLILLCQVLFLLNAMALGTLVWFGLAVPLVVLALTAMNGLVQAVDLPARLALVPELVPKADLVNAVGLNSLLFNLGRAVGPAIAGLVFLACGAILGPDAESLEVTRIGATACFAVNAASYAAVIGGLLAMTPAAADVTKKPGRVSEGLRFVWRNKPLAVLLGCTFAASFFGWPLLTLFPAYTRTVLNHAEKEYSWLVSALGAGALVAALGNATFGSIPRARAFIGVGSVLTAAAVWGMTVSTDLLPAALFAALFGFGMVLYLSTGQIVLQLSTPDDARGRVMALWPMTLSGGAVGGHLLSGWGAKVWPVPQVMGVMAIGVTLTAATVVVLAWLIPRKREVAAVTGERLPG
jgi:MFS family permease